MHNYFLQLNQYLLLFDKMKYNMDRDGFGLKLSVGLKILNITRKNYLS
jgi:hypothetical protein